MNGGSRAASRVKLPRDAPLSARLVIQQLEELVAGAKHDISPKLVDQILKGGNRGWRRAGLPPPPDALEVLGKERWKIADPRSRLRTIWVIDGPQTATRLEKWLSRLNRVNQRITEAISVDFLRELLRKFERKDARVLSKEQFENLEGRILGRAGEDTAIRHPKFLAIVERESEEVTQLNQHSSFLGRHSLKNIDPTPLLVTSVRTAGRSGPTDARLMYVDFVVLFRANTIEGGVKYLRKILGQVKLSMVHLLISDLDEYGRYRMGQLLKDKLRADIGPWHFDWVQFDQDMFIKEPRLTKLLTLGSRELTEEEILRLGIVDRIHIDDHLVHEIPYDDFRRWKDELIRLLGIKVK
jgi:hypothetical protein